MNKKFKKILCLSGGVGGAKLAYGFSRLLPPEQLNIVVNTADDFEHLDYLICPDIDTVTYTLAGINNKAQGWGIENETWLYMEEIAIEGKETWFRLGDKDVHTHRERKHYLGKGKTLSETTAIISHHYGVTHHILPMSDEKVSTVVQTKAGNIPFQHYFVQEKCIPKVTGFQFDGIDTATPTTNFILALTDPELAAVVICPSNPYVSIDPILSLKGIKEKLRLLTIPVIAVSPIISGKAIKGPTTKIMKELKVPRTSLAIAHHYHGIINTLIIDESDYAEQTLIEKIGIRCMATRTLMKTDADKEALAQFILGMV